MTESAVAEPAELEIPSWVAARPSRDHRVTAVLVAHNGAAWLPATLATLAGQDRAPDAVIGVDTGSVDASAMLLVSSLGADRVLRLQADVAFGAAVSAGVDAVPAAGDEQVVEWIWVLHDDSAPDPHCLEHLLRAADEYPRAAVLGAKSLGWHDRRLLFDVGFTVTGSGRRVTGLERSEHDQGQHDGRSTVLAVGSAGMLVRRDVWNDLGGFDPALTLFRDDLDLCWRAHRAGYEVRVVPAAVVHHREASYHGRRVSGSRRSSGSDAAKPARMHRADRRSALHVLLAHAPAWRLPLTYLRLVLGTLLRSVLYVVGKDLPRAGDELAALWSVLTHPGRIAAARARMRGLQPASVVSDLRPRARSQVRAALEAMAGIITAGRSPSEGVVDDEEDFPDDSRPGIIRRTLARPGVWLPLALVALTLVATRSLWFGDGVLQGGALLPAPQGAADLWAAYAAAWHEIGPGSNTPAPPWIAVLAVLATVLLGKAPLAVSALVLLASAASAVSAYLAVRDVVDSRPVRVWLSATYALLPAVTGAVATGRLGTIAAAILLPPAVRLLARCAGVPGALPAATPRTPWVAALVLALLFAFAPVLWPIAVVVAVAAAVLALRRGRVRLVVGLAVAVLAPAVLLLPWSLELLRQPARLLSEPGLAVREAVGAPLDVLVLDPGGSGTPPAWVFAGLMLAAVLSCLRIDRIRLTLALWGVGLLALAAAVLQTRVLYLPVGSAQPAPSWPGATTLLLGAVAVTVVGVTADGLRERIGGASFGWRQPGALVLAVVAGLAPVLAAALWIADPAGPLRRGGADLLPAYVAEESAGPAQTRSLVLQRDEAGRIQYTVVSGAGLRLPDADLVPAQEYWTDLDAIVSAVAAGRGGDEVRALAAYAVGYVLLTDAGELADPLVAALDSEPGLRRLSSPESGALWRVAGTTSLVRVVGADGVPVPAPGGVVPAGEGERVLVVAQRADAGWRARIADQALSPVPVQAPLATWSQGFALPGAEAADVFVEFDDSGRQTWLWLQLIALVIVIVLALPTRAPRDPDSEDLDVMSESGTALASDSAPDAATSVPVLEER